MCLKNVNTITRFYDEIVYNSNTVAYINQFDHVCVKYDEDNKPYIGDFFIVTDVNLLGTKKPELSNYNFIEKGDVVEFKIRLTKVNPEPEKQYTWDLDSFEIDTKEDFNEACVKYHNSTRITNIKKISLRTDDNFIGEYVVKVLIRKKNCSDNDKWNVQSIMLLVIE